MSPCRSPEAIHPIMPNEKHRRLIRWIGDTTVPHFDFNADTRQCSIFRPSAPERSRQAYAGTTEVPTRFQILPIDVLYWLWFVFAWLLLDAVTFKQRTRPLVDESGKANSVRVLVFAFKLAIAGIFVFVCFNPMRHDMIRKFLEQFYFLPMTNFFIDGSLSWRLALSPVTALIAIAFLLHLNRKFKRREA